MLLYLFISCFFCLVVFILSLIVFCVFVALSFCIVLVNKRKVTSECGVKGRCIKKKERKKRSYLIHVSLMSSLQEHFVLLMLNETSQKKKEFRH